MSAWQTWCKNQRENGGNYSINDIGVNFERARLLPQYKDQASTADQRAEKTKEKGKKEAFIGGSRSRSQATPGDVPGTERDVEHSTRYQVTGLTRSDGTQRSMTGFKEVGLQRAASKDSPASRFTCQLAQAVELWVCGGSDPADWVGWV